MPLTYCFFTLVLDLLRLLFESGCYYLIHFTSYLFRALKTTDLNQKELLLLYGLAWAYCYSDQSNIQRPLASVNLGVQLYIIERELVLKYFLIMQKKPCAIYFAKWPQSRCKRSPRAVWCFASQIFIKKMRLLLESGCYIKIHFLSGKFAALIRERHLLECGT